MQTARSASSCLAVLLIVGAACGQASVNLSSWTPESYGAVSGFGPGQWNVAATGDSVTQTVNGQPTLFFSPFNAFNTQTQGQIMAGAGDDDYVGFAIGFEPGDSLNPVADYLLIDWKKGTQAFNFGAPSCTPGSTANVGLAVSRVTGIPSADEFWGHVNLDTAPCSGPGDGLVELARATTLGSTGWVTGTQYNFTFDFSATRLRVYVDGVLEIDISGIFRNGRLAFYNFSQANVTYSAYTVNCVAAWSNYGDGYPGTVGTPALTLSVNPSFGSLTTLDLGSSNPNPSAAILGISGAPAAISTAVGGTLLVDFPTLLLIPLTLPPGLTQVPIGIPTDPSLCATALYLQFVQEDPGAMGGLAFSKGLETVFGS
jgi:hypothetical protein